MTRSQLDSKITRLMRATNTTRDQIRDRLGRPLSRARKAEMVELAAELTKVEAAAQTSLSRNWVTRTAEELNWQGPVDRLTADEREVLATRVERVEANQAKERIEAERLLHAVELSQALGNLCPSGPDGYHVLDSDGSCVWCDYGTTEGGDALTATRCRACQAPSIPDRNGEPEPCRVCAGQPEAVAVELRRVLHRVRLGGTIKALDVSLAMGQTGWDGSAWWNRGELNRVFKLAQERGWVLRPSTSQVEWTQDGVDEAQAERAQRETGVGFGFVASGVFRVGGEDSLAVAERSGREWMLWLDRADTEPATRAKTLSEVGEWVAGRIKTPSRVEPSSVILLDRIRFVLPAGHDPNQVDALGQALRERLAEVARGLGLVVEGL